MFDLNKIKEKLNIYEKEYISFTRCLIRDVEIKLSGHPEELVRQCLLLYLLEKFSAYLSRIYFTVERDNIDIAIYRKCDHADFQPMLPPIIIIEVKKKEEKIINYEKQLLKYLKIKKCERGVLFNSIDVLYYDKGTITSDYSLESIVTDVTSNITSKNNDIHIFNKAKSGDLYSFLYLLKVYGKYKNRIIFSIKDGQIIEGFLFRIIDNKIYYDYYGVYDCDSEKKSIPFSDFHKLISIIF